MAFKELEKGKTHEVEMDILKTWEKMDILKQCIDNRKGCENFVFYDSRLSQAFGLDLLNIFRINVSFSFYVDVIWMIIYQVTSGN